MMLQVVPKPLFFDMFIRVPSVDFDEKTQPVKGADGGAENL
jgi:hypothetical protein